MDSATLDQRMMELMGGLKTEDEEDIKVVENEGENEGESSDENLQEEAEDKFVEDEKELGGGQKKKSFAFVRFRGSDPRAATCRGKLQHERSKLNADINKELMLRSGAENLFKATTNRKLKETVALELSYVNSNLQLLKEKLAELNSSVDVYQEDPRDGKLPMIPLGLKETKDSDCKEALLDFILEHYSEDSDEYKDSVVEFLDIRRAMRTPARNSTGIAFLFEYFNQLYFIERRFFSPERNLGIYFEWYDSLTGLPHSQRTVAFEKACVLFNIAALFTQIGTRQNRSSVQGLDEAVENYLRAAGTFRYIHENFTNAPSMDLNPRTLEFLVHLMCAQARECLFEKLEILSVVLDDNLLKKESKSSNEKTSKRARSNNSTDEGQDSSESSEEERYSDSGVADQTEHLFALGQEAAYVSEVHSKVHESLQSMEEYIPQSWSSLVQMKRNHYKALTHYYIARGLIESQPLIVDEDSLRSLYANNPDPKTIFGPEYNAINKSSGKTSTAASGAGVVSRMDRKYLGKAHLREALLLHEETMRLNRMCRKLKNKDQLKNAISERHDRTMDYYSKWDDEDDFGDMISEPPEVNPLTQFQLSLSFPDFGQYKVEDLFRNLGPMAVFNARTFWSAPRTVILEKRSDEGFGFSIKGDSPVFVTGVERNSLAEMGGLREGDYIVSISGANVKWSRHDEVVALIKGSKNAIHFQIVSPVTTNKTNYNNSVTSLPVDFAVSSSDDAINSRDLHSPMESLLMDHHHQYQQENGRSVSMDRRRDRRSGSEGPVRSRSTSSSHKKSISTREERNGSRKLKIPFTWKE